MSEEKKDEATAAEGPPPLPEGVMAFFLSDSHAQKLGMKTGAGIVDLVPMATFNKDMYLKEIAELGFMCPFEPVEKQLKECPLEEFLVLTDIESVHGEMFLLYYGAEAIKNLTEKASQEAAAKKAEEERLAAEAEAARIAEEARKNAVYVDEPMYPQVYISETADATHAEVDELSIKLNRPLISFSIGRPFKSCNKPASFGDRELDSGIVASQKTRVPEFDMQRMERDIGVQACDAGKDGCSQTTWNRPVNKTTQVSEEGGAASEARRAKRVAKRGSCVSGGYGGVERTPPPCPFLPPPALSTNLRRSLPPPTCRSQKSTLAPSPTCSKRPSARSRLRFSRMRL